MLTILLSLAVMAIINPAVPPDALGPPWPAGADETPAQDSPRFKRCHETIQLLAERVGSRAEDLRYAHSPKWGWILRARVVKPGGPAELTQRFTCWSLTGEHVKLSIAPEHMFDDPPAPPG